MSIDITVLATDIASGPLAAACAEYMSAANDVAVAALFNSLTGPGAEVISLTQCPKNDFLKWTTPAAVRLAVGFGTDSNTIPALTIAKWSAALMQGRAADPGSKIDLAIVALLGDPVDDKVMSSGEYAALTSRMGNRAEHLFGGDTAVSPQDIIAVRLLSGDHR